MSVSFVDLAHVSTNIFSEFSVWDHLEAVHSVSLINVYLDLGNPGGSGFWVREHRWGTRGQRGSVCKHQGAEVDNSYHSWRVPSK
jgi:hypothetical protein